MKKSLLRFTEHNEMSAPSYYNAHNVCICKNEKHTHFDDDLYEWQYLTFESLTDNNVFSITCSSSQTDNAQTILVSLNNGRTWVEKTATSGGTEIFTLNAGKKAIVKSTTWKSNATNNYFTTHRLCFLSSDEYKVYGNILSLIHGDNFANENSLSGIKRTFQHLFYNSVNLKDAKNLILPFTNCTSYCCYYMFYGCTSLVKGPKKLQSTKLAQNCYMRMFEGCTSLTTAPELPATTLASSCYSYMFYGCTSLTAASELPATTLADNCYNGMFSHCTSLVNAPELPATTLAGSCYIDMFYSCSSLKTGPTILPSLTLYSQCYRRMFRYCKNLENAPILPASTLVTYCYHYMFDGANKINQIKCLATSGLDTENCLTNWLQNVASTGTFTKAQGITWTDGNSGIPTGWTVVEEAV